MARVWSSISVIHSTPGLSRLQRYYMARVRSSPSEIQLYSGFIALATILHGACVFLCSLGDTLYSGFVALAPILHGACVFLYYLGDTLYSGFVALAPILHGACVFLYLGDTLYTGLVALAPILHGACVFLYSVMCRFSFSLHAAGRSLQGSRSLS